jgi:hypothetical protein
MTILSKTLLVSLLRLFGLVLVPSVDEHGGVKQKEHFSIQY